jgi:hypothetical protein
MHAYAGERNTIRAEAQGGNRSKSKAHRVPSLQDAICGRGSSFGNSWRNTAAPDPFFWEDRNERAATSAVRRDNHKSLPLARSVRKRTKKQVHNIPSTKAAFQQVAARFQHLPFVSATEGGPEVAARLPERSLLLCWPPDEVSRPPSASERRPFLQVPVLQVLKTALSALLQDRLFSKVLRVIIPCLGLEGGPKTGPMSMSQTVSEFVDDGLLPCCVLSASASVSSGCGYGLLAVVRCGLFSTIPD